MSLPFASGAGAGGDAGCNFHTQLRAEPLWHLHAVRMPPETFPAGSGRLGAPREGIGRWVRVSREAKATVGIVSHCSLPPPSPP